MLRHRFIARGAVAFAAACASGVLVPAAFAADTTSTTVSPPTTTAVWGQPVNLTVVVQNTSTSATPMGSVQLNEDATPIGASATLVGGQATITVTTLEVGPHTLTATFTPTDATAFVASTSTPGVSVMVARAETTTTFAATPSPSVAGQSVTLQAAVSASPPGAGTPTGSVQFANHGGPAFDTVALDPMAHASTLAYGFAGLYQLDADYAGDMHFNSSTAAILARVNRAATTTALTVTPNPAAPGATITYTAIVGVVPPGDVDPAGSLQFTIDGAPVGAAIGLGGGAIGYQGTLTAPPGDRTYLVAVAYSGDEDTEPSSASLAVTIAGPAAVAAAATSVAPVATAQLKAMVSTLTTALRLRGFAALTSVTQTLTAGPGIVEQKVSTTNAPRGARAAAARPVVIAAGSHRFATAGRGALRLKLTKAGRRAIRHAKSLKLAIVTRYTPTGGRAVTTTQRLTVRAKGRKHGRAAAEGWYALGGTLR